MDIEETNRKYIEALEKRLNEFLEPKKPEIIYEAMAYSVNAGGKRLRPVLLLAACENSCGEYEKALDYACALEMIHTYSLIHDDLPAMDNDDLRRGMPTSHIKFDEAIAILAGDALLNKAFEIMAERVTDGREYAEAMKIIAKAAGTQGMIGGQTLDVTSEGKKISPEDLEFIHKNKTAALITAALKAGAVIGGASGESLSLYETAGECMGVAFQIMDDILDVTSNEEVLGKPVLSDERNEKATYVSMYSLDKAKADCELLSQKALEAISSASGIDSFLYKYAERLAKRKF